MDKIVNQVIKERFLTQDKEQKAQLGGTMKDIIQDMDIKNLPNQSKSQKELQDSKKSSKVIKETRFKPQDVTALGQALGACLLVQRTYGKQGADVDKIAKIFLKVLDCYEPKDVIEAIKQWLKKSPEFPTPSDIVKMIDGEFIPDRAYYQEICNQIKRGESHYSINWTYKKKYEEYIKRGY